MALAIFCSGSDLLALASSGLGEFPASLPCGTRAAHSGAEGMMHDSGQNLWLSLEWNPDSEGK